jgi:hypothetical protein
MSRGPGSLQRRILAVLQTHAELKLSRGEIRVLFPDADPANLRRALRSLAGMGLSYERTEPPELDPATDEWAPRWVFLVRSQPVSSEERDK